MCGRFSLVDGTSKIEKRFGGRFVDADFETASGPTYNAAPSMTMPIVVASKSHDSREKEIVMAKWGLLPTWGTHLRPQANARLDTAAEKRMFRDAFARRHCLIPANSFFEWHREKGIKQPYRIMVGNGELFAMAGIWELPRFPDRKPTFSILTTDANQLVAKIHDRMPVILEKKDEDTWLSEADKGIATIQTQFSAKKMAMYPVSTKVNKVSYNDRDALKPVKEPSLWN